MAEGVTAEDLARDLTADLALCEAAPPGPWLDLFAGSNGLQRYVAPAGWRGLPVLYSYCPPHAALNMACAAREGWPAAIRLALHWRGELEKERAAHKVTFDYFVDEVKRKTAALGNSLEGLVECRNQMLDRDEEVARLRLRVAELEGGQR